MMSSFLEQVKTSRSLRLQIGILYSLLALINILFFSVLIFENQTELLVKNFNYQSVNFVISILEDLKDKSISRERDNSIKQLANTLKFHEINQFNIFDEQGTIVHSVYLNETGEAIHNEEKEKTPIDEEIFKKGKELVDSTAFFTSKYKLELNDNDFSIRIWIPISSQEKKENLFLFSELSIRSIKERLNKLYFQIAIAFVWGMLTHTLFGIYINRVIFTRVQNLKEVTDRMATGDLNARVEWKFEKSDELDILGRAFNGMATKIQADFTTIKNLNDEINSELKIGKEVQEMFLPANKKFKDFKVATFYRPMREVSGDIYHFYRFRSAKNKKKYAGFFFADASGHGVSAALVTTVTLLSIESIITRSIRPNFIIQQLANIIGNRFQSSFFATGVFFLVNEKGHLIASNAGHNAPICFRPSTGEMIFFKSCGPPLGMADDFPYKLLKAKTRSGDKLFIYSDGLTESPGPNEEQFSEKRVIELIKNNMNLSNKELINLLWEELDKFAIDYRDDVSMVLLEIP